MATIACAWCAKELTRTSPKSVVSHGLCVACAGRHGFFPAQDHLTVSPAEFERLPFGTIEVDGEGVVRSYVPAAMAGTGPDPSSILGRHFFSQVVPWTVAQRLEDQFTDFVARGATGGAGFPFYFRTVGGERLVLVELIYNARQGLSRITVEELS